MRTIVTLAILMAALFSSVSAYGFSTKGEDCAKCHTLKKEDAAVILKEIVPNIKVLDIRIAPLRSMWEVSFESDGKKGLLYIDFTKKYLISGSLVDIIGKKNLTQERFTDLNRVNVSKIPVKDAIVLGNKSAKHKVIVFTDPDCPFCSKIHPEMKKVVTERSDIVFLIKMFPLPMHKEAFDKSKTIVCEKSLSVLEDAFEKKPIPKPKCTTKVVDETIKLAQSLGINGTPTMVMPDGRLMSGFFDANALKGMIDKK